MTFESAADRLAMLNACGGVTATIGVASVTGILDREYIEVQGVEGYAPVFTCLTADVSSVSHGDTATINSVAYTVRGIQPDGTGVTVLVLEAT